MFSYLIKHKFWYIKIKNIQSVRFKHNHIVSNCIETLNTDYIFVISILGTIKELSWIEMGLERFIRPLINQKLLWSSRTIWHIQFLKAYRWFRQSKHSRDSNGKILPCWFVSNTLRISSGTKTSASSLRKTFGESIFNDECENCLTSCDLLVGCEVDTKFGFDIQKMKF